MNTVVIARKLNERRHRPNPVITTGEIISTLGASGMQEAIQRNWLVPDQDTGFMMVNVNAGKLAEIAEACHCPDCRLADCACDGLSKDVQESRSTVMPDGMRSRQVLNETWGAPGVGNGSNGLRGQTPMMPSAPQSVAPTTPPAKKPLVGDTVDTTEIVDGKPRVYRGRINRVQGAPGQEQYGLDFDGGDRPPTNHEYGAQQLQALAQSNA